MKHTSGPGGPRLNAVEKGGKVIEGAQREQGPVARGPSIHSAGCFRAMGAGVMKFLSSERVDEIRVAWGSTPDI